MRAQQEVHADMARIGPFGIWEILIIAALILLLFGPKKLPELARGIGQAITEFRRGVNELSRSVETELKAESEAAPEARTDVSAATVATPQPPAEGEDRQVRS